MNRREFLFSSLSLITLLGSEAWLGRAANLNSNKRLIVVFLRGAVDGLNVVIPYTEEIYYKVRPTIAIPKPDQAGGALALNNSFALNPNLQPLMSFWTNKQLAFVHASGLPTTSRSHFEVQDYMEVGIPNYSKIQNGWMNRLLTVLNTKSSAEAISVGANTPRILEGKAPVHNMASGKNALKELSVEKNKRLRGAFDKLYSGEDKLSQAYKEGQISREEIRSSLAEEMVAANKGAPNAARFVLDAQRVGKLMLSDANYKLGFLQVGGWDTHINQNNPLSNNLKLLSRGLVELNRALGPLQKDSLIVVMSEFGRTVKENGNKGTDHGHGNAMWLMGGNIKGKQIYGKWPTLASGALYEGRDLAITTDFRDVLATAIQNQFSLNSSELQNVFPNYAFKGRVF